MTTARTHTFYVVLLLDAVMYAALFARDYTVPGQWLIAHYISFVAITDLGAFFLPREKRHWFNLFRLTSGVSLSVLVIALAAKGLDGELIALTLFRLLTTLLRTAHAAYELRRGGPSLAELKEFPNQATAYFRQGTHSERWGCGYLVVGLALLYFPQLAYWTHYNAGVNELDDILTGLQAQAGLNFCIKLFVFEVLLTNSTARLYMRSIVAGLFLIQWPFMLDMFVKAPIPVFHIAVELFEVWLVVLAFRQRQPKHRA